MYTSFGAHFVKEMPPNRRGVPEKKLPMYEPPCICSVCKEQYIPLRKQKKEHNHSTYKGSMSRREAETLVQTLSRETRIDRSFLADNCRAHGDAILDAWKGMEATERAKVLLEVDPNMYEYQWGEARHCAEFQWGDIGTAMRDFRNFNLLPYINLEALSEDPARLLNLLFNRVKYSPEEWAPYDSHKLRLPWNTGAFEIYYNQSCVVMQGLHYGTLVPWDREKAHTWEIVGFPRARLVLEAQRQLIKVLRRVVEILLKEDISNSLSLDRLFHLSAIEFEQTGDCGFTSSYLNQPFSAPPLFDLEKLRSIAQTRRDAAGDHVWLLQTDPQYIRHWIAEIGKIEYCEIEPSKNKYAFIAREFFHDVHTFWSWKWLLEEVENVERVYKRCQGKVSRGEALPEALSHALGALENLLTHMLDRLSRHIQATICERPGFREGWEIEYNAIPGKALAIRTDGIREPDRFYRDPLDWCLRQLLGDPDGPVKYEHAMLFAFLEDHFASSPPEEKARLDEVLYTKYSDFAALHEMRVMVRLHRPRGTSLHFEEYKSMEIRRVWRFTRKEILEGGLIWLAGLAGRRSTQANALEQFDLQKAPDAASKNTTGCLTECDEEREALSAFWKVIRDQHDEFFTTKGMTVAEIEELKSDLSADTSPENVAALKVERDEILAIIEERKASKPATPSYSALLKKLNKGKQGKKSKSRGKWKGKSNGKSNNNSKTCSYKQENLPPATSEPDQGSEESDEQREVEDDSSSQSLGEQETVDEQPQPMAPENKSRTLYNGSLPLGRFGLSEKSTVEETPTEKSSKKRNSKDLIPETPKTNPTKNAAPPKVAVKQRVLDIIQDMFLGRCAAGSSPLAWDSFVHVMDQVGFAARHSGGSAVLFEPKSGTAWYGKGTIVFHRPHPSSKIAPIRLRAMGKRMGKWFGWTRNAFVLEEKQK